METDFSLSIENAKSLLEGISKQICMERSVGLTGTESFNSVIKSAFDAIGYERGQYINVIGSSLSAIAQQVGNLRTAVGPTAHGKTIEELEKRNDLINDLSKGFLIDSIDLVASFLIRNYESEHPGSEPEEREAEDYLDFEEFNEFWDEEYGEFFMGEYSYLASEVLYNIDQKAYKYEKQEFENREEQS